MQIGDIKSVMYWRKSYPVEAIRLTSENMQQIADYLGGEYYLAKDPYISYNNDEAIAGDWVIKHEDRILFMTHEDFIACFKSHSEEISENVRYAKIFQLVASAMSKQDAATFHGDQEGMDLLTIETVKKIIGEL